jgi:hypothetical protein
MSIQQRDAKVAVFAGKQYESEVLFAPLQRVRSRRLCGALVILLSLVFCDSSSLGAFGSEIDRLLVTVNGRVITEGDLDLARSLIAIVFYDKNSGPGSREDQIAKLIDQELMRQELKNFSQTQEDESKVEARLQSLREAYAEKGGLPPLLKRLGLQESELIAYLKLESSILKFVNFRFGPFATVSEQEIKNYYETRLTPQLQKARIDLPELKQISGRIEEILREEKVNTLLEQWIREIRRNSRIEYFDGARDSGTSEAESTKP